MGYLKKPVEKAKRASAQRLMKSQLLVRSRFWLAPFFLLVRSFLNPIQGAALLLPPISKGAYVLHSLPLNDEARSGRRDLNPQPQPWQGYALP